MYFVARVIDNDVFFVARVIDNDVLCRSSYPVGAVDLSTMIIVIIITAVLKDIIIPVE